MKSVSAFFVISLLTATICNAQTQPQTPGSSFRQEGIASWYGAEFAGRPTASGEIFDPNQFTAAHPDLPFGTVLIITNAVNGEKVMVRVNDRGPFVKSRIVDVSRAAAEKLNMLETGTAQVIIELAPRNASTGALVTATPPTTSGFYYDAPEQRAGTTVSESPPPVQQPTPISAAAPSYTSVQPSAVQESSAPQTAWQPAADPQATAPAAPQTAWQPAADPQATAPAAPQTAWQPAAGLQTTAPVIPQTEWQPAADPQTTAPATPQTTGQMAVAPQTTAPVLPQTTRQPTPVVPTGRQPGSTPSGGFQPVPTTARPPVPPQSASPAPSLPETSSVPPTSGTQPPQQRPSQRYTAANIIGGPVVEGKYYRIQIGSFRVAKNAVDVFDRLTEAGLKPQWEPFENMYRIVISNVPGEEVDSTAERLGEAGFREVIVREER